MDSRRIKKEISFDAKQLDQKKSYQSKKVFLTIAIVFTDLGHKSTLQPSKLFQITSTKCLVQCSTNDVQMLYKCSH